MGSGLSQVQVEKMPTYFVEKPEVNQTAVGILLRSVGNITGDVKKHKNEVLPFTVFYQSFYDKLEELKDDLLNPLNHLEDGFTVQVRSLYLVRLLRLVCVLPQNVIKKNIDSHGALDTESRRELLRFYKTYPTVKLECYGPVGEALFYAVQQNDEMYTKTVNDVWIMCYSLFLRHYIPMAARRKTKKRNSVRRTPSPYDLSSDAYSSSEDLDGITSDEINSEEDSCLTALSSPRRKTLHRMLADKMMKTRLHRPRSGSSPSKYVKNALIRITRRVEAGERQECMNHVRPCPDAESSQKYRSSSFCIVKSVTPSRVSSRGDMRNKRFKFSENKSATCGERYPNMDMEEVSSIHSYKKKLGIEVRRHRRRARISPEVHFRKNTLKTLWVEREQIERARRKSAPCILETSFIVSKINV